MQIHYSSEEIGGLSRFNRANLINSLSGVKSCSLISTIAKDGIANLAIFNNIFHLGADPALLGLICRPKAAGGHTISNIETTQHFFINHVTKEFYRQAHLTSAKFSEEVDEFEVLKLEKQYHDGIAVPAVKLSPLQIHCKLEEIIPVKLNNTNIVIASVKNIYVAKEMITNDGYLNFNKVPIIASHSIDAYYEVKLMDRLAYAKPFAEALSILNME